MSDLALTDRPGRLTRWQLGYLVAVLAAALVSFVASFFIMIGPCNENDPCGREVPSYTPVVVVGVTVQIAAAATAVGIGRRAWPQAKRPATVAGLCAGLWTPLLVLTWLLVTMLLRYLSALG